MKNLKQYDVVLVDFGKEVIGSEQGGIRPAVVVQNNTGNFFSTTTLVMACTTKPKSLNQPTHTLIEKGSEKGLVHDSIVLGESLRQVSEKRIKRILGSITDENERSEIIRVYEANL